MESSPKSSSNSEKPSGSATCLTKRRIPRSSLARAVELPEISSHGLLYAPVGSIANMRPPARSGSRASARVEGGTGEVSCEIRGNDPAIAERQAARQAVSLARDVRTAERNATRLAGVAREADEKAARDVAVAAEDAARDAAVEAEQAARGAEVARQAADDVALEAQRKAARDARYAARKARPRKR